MSKTLISVVASVCLLAPLPVQGALAIVNGGFESTSPPGSGFITEGWYKARSTDVTITSAMENVHSGTRAAQLAQQALFGYGHIGQGVGADPGSTYIVDFWAKGAVAGQRLVVGWESGTLGVIPITTTYTHYALTKTLTSQYGSNLFFNNSLDGSPTIWLDDVRLTLVGVPEPTTMIAGALLLLLVAVSRSGYGASNAWRNWVEAKQV